LEKYWGYIKNLENLEWFLRNSAPTNSKKALTPGGIRMRMIIIRASGQDGE
jgi:hypothetical protein